MTSYDRSKRERHLFLKATLLLIVAVVLLAATSVNPPRTTEASVGEAMTCRDGAVGACSINGKDGTRECIRGRWGPCDVETEPTPDPTKTGTVRPKYYVLTVVYAPPGTQGGRSTSSVKYGSGSTTGTTVSSANSFKQNYSVSVSSSVGFLGTGGSVGASFEYGRNSSDGKSLDIKKTATTEISDTGPGSDGISHDHDIIYLWLNPSIQLSLTPTSGAWKLSTNNTADIQYVYVGWLKNPSQMPAGVVQRLQTYGIDSQDYQQILKTDPFANGNTTIDSARYQMVNTTFPYEPPFSQNDPVPAFSFILNYASNASSTSSVQNDYKVGATASGSVGFLGLFKASIKTAASWDWTSTDTRVKTTGTSESAATTVGGPAFGYSGPTDMGVYYDTLYKTFLFAPVENAIPALKGSVTRPGGRAAVGKEITVVASGKKYRTFTNGRGEYRLFGSISGPVRLQVGGLVKQLPQLPANRQANLVVP